MKPIAYYKLVMLSNELKAKHKIKIGARIPRYDCVLYNGDYPGVTPFINSKGMFYLNLFESDKVIKSNERRLSEFVLKSPHLNFTSLYFENIEAPNICYGYPNGKPLLSNGNINPLFHFRNDLYIIIINNEYTEIEVLVFKNQKGFANYFLQGFINNEFDEELDRIRATSKPFYDYESVI